MEWLESRELKTVLDIGRDGTFVYVTSDSNPTNVTVSGNDNTLTIVDHDTGRLWSFFEWLPANQPAPPPVQWKLNFAGSSRDDWFVSTHPHALVTAYGFGGDDHLEVTAGRGATLYGGDGHDVLIGSEATDRLEGNAGDDFLFGLASNDVLLGQDGDDQLFGGNGNDELIGHDGIDRFVGEDGDDVLVAIDARYLDAVEAGPGRDTLWIDWNGFTGDLLSGVDADDKLHKVLRFANTTDRTLNFDRFADPTPLPGHTYNPFFNRPLFSRTGPASGDVRMGALADAYLLNELSATAGNNALAIRQNIVDFRDGTYGVRIGDVFYRIDYDLPVTSSTSWTPAYAQLGAENSLWVALMEKAYALHRGQNSYASLINPLFYTGRLFASSSIFSQLATATTFSTSSASTSPSLVSPLQTTTVSTTTNSGTLLVSPGIESTNDGDDDDPPESSLLSPTLITVLASPLMAQGALTT